MDTQMRTAPICAKPASDRAALIMTIKCGLPGTGMPPFDKFAYSDGRCYGLKQADLRQPASACPTRRPPCRTGKLSTSRNFHVCQR